MDLSSPPLRVLHLEDNPRDADFGPHGLEREGISAEITRVVDRPSYVAALEKGAYGLIISDYTIPGFDGSSALALARERAPATPFIFVSGTIGEEVAVETLKKGATNYVLKHHIERLGPAVRGALQETCERENLRCAERELREKVEFFRRISENVTDLVAVLDLEGRRLYTSPSYQALLG